MKLLPPFIFWCLWFFNISNRTVFSPILPLIEDSLQISHGKAGGLFTSLSLGFSLTLLITGRFASNWGYKRLVVIGFIGISLVLIIAIRAIFGVGGGPFILGLVADHLNFQVWILSI